MHRRSVSARSALPPLAAVVTAVLWSVPAEAQMISPGPLSLHHGELDDEVFCDQCHGDGRRVENGRCLACHDEIGARISKGAGLHGRAYRRRRCGQCHVEHHGRGSSLIRWPGGGMKGFDHRQTGWPLEGSHAGVECGRCHKRARASGTRSFLGQSTTCSACHKTNPHGGRLGDRCNQCHSPQGWKRVKIADLDHGLTRFPLKGKHAGVSCPSCHGDPPNYTGLRFGGCSACHDKSRHEGTRYERCETCHVEAGWGELGRVAKNHPGVKLRGGHAKVECRRCHGKRLDSRPAKGNNCAACHAQAHEAPFGRRCVECHTTIQWRGLPRKVSVAAHAKTGMPLVGGHQDVACDQCHGKGRRRPRRDLELGGCADCHDDRHKGTFAKQGGGECSQCHEVAGFYPSRFGIEEHESTDFPLEGRHRAAPCEGCHGKRPRTDFDIPDQRCHACHEPPHGDQFAAEMGETGCAHCHNFSGWECRNIDHTAWPRDGAHAALPCQSCHTPSKADRKAGRGASYRGLPRECSGCHEDPHAGQFRLSEPARQCGSCHTTTTFEQTGFDHEKMTGFPLVGQHEEVPCAECHPEERLDGDTVARRYRLGYRQCRDCHRNPHGMGSSRRKGR